MEAIVVNAQRFSASSAVRINSVQVLLGGAAADSICTTFWADAAWGQSARRHARQAAPTKTTLLVPQKNRTGRLYLSGRAPGEADQLNEPKLLTGLLDEQVVMASCGARHTALVLGGGQVATCGDGAHGKLGHGTDEAKPEFILVAALGAVHIRG